MTKDEFLALSAEKYDRLQQLNQIIDFYEYEKTFDEIWTEFGRCTFEKNLGELPKNYQKKTLSELVTEK